MTETLKMGFLLYPQLTLLDLVGPAQLLGATPGAQLHYVSRVLAPVPTDAGVAITPTHTFDDCPALDLLFVPGGPGQQPQMQNRAVLGWLQRQGEQARWVTSVCSGSLLLGAAGLLKGYRAATHWNYREYLPLFGATIDTARVVIDRNRITGGGVTAGIDFALQVIAAWRGDELAQEIQLQYEYAPQPPFNSGRPELATPERVARVQAKLAAALEQAA
jgi:cyclohexyl-isocyanide hydratase